MEKELRVTYWEEGKRLANFACWAIELQIKRLQQIEPEIPEFVMQPVADFHFLVTAIASLRKAADLACQASDITAQIEAFDDAVPDWRQIRNTLEHIDEYWQRKGRDKQLRPGDLATIKFGPVIQWAGLRLDLKSTLAAANNLFVAIKGIWPLPNEGT